jgi:hypothetical protein
VSLNINFGGDDKINPAGPNENAESNRGMDSFAFGKFPFGGLKEKDGPLRSSWFGVRPCFDRVTILVVVVE